jgi:hypothetical protein
MIKIGKLLKDIKKETLIHKGGNTHLYWALCKILSDFSDGDFSGAEIGYDEIFGDSVSTNDRDEKQLLFVRKEAMARLEVVNSKLKEMGFKSKVICRYGHRDDKSFWMCSPFISVEL